MADKGKRSNLWISIIYPGDSLPENYLSIIQSWHLPVLLSPVHDADLNADSSEKKKHIHLMMDFGSGQNKSFDQVLTFSTMLKGTFPIICHNRNSMIRYFIHADNPEKHQYKQDDLVTFGGFDYSSAFDNYTSEDLVYKSIENIIYDNVIYNYAVLLKYLDAKSLNYEKMFLRRHSLHFRSLLDGQYQLIQQGRQIIVDSNSDINDYVFVKDIVDKKN